MVLKQALSSDLSPDPYVVSTLTSRSEKTGFDSISYLPWNHPFLHNGYSEDDPYSTMRILVCALFLTTTVAFLSAWDAQNHCISNEMDAWGGLQNDDVGDDTSALLDADAILTIKSTCRQMFLYTLLPMGTTTWIGTAAEYFILHRYSSQLMGTFRQVLTPIQSPPPFLLFHLPLLFLSALILCVWSIGILLVMVSPRFGNISGKNNPYLSLAAVDSMGRVGDNANLYYFCWISEALAISIFYKLTDGWLRQKALATLGRKSLKRKKCGGPTPRDVFPIDLHHKGSTELSHSILQHQASHSVTHGHQKLNLPARAQWFQTFYRLRFRTGMWVAALLSTVVVFASSFHLFHAVLKPAAFDRSVNGTTSLDRDGWFYQYEVCSTIAINTNNGSLDDISGIVSEEFCFRTIAAMWSGILGASLCGFAIAIHLFARRSAAADTIHYEATDGYSREVAKASTKSRRHQKIEMTLSAFVSFLLGCNACWVSGVQGPAATVGNLYYASWLSFLLCLRVCLGCVEELFDLLVQEKAESVPEPRINSGQPSNVSAKVAATICEPSSKASNYGIKYATCSVERSTMNERAHEHDQHVLAQQVFSDQIEEERVERIRRYFFLGIFSIVCAASALDASRNQDGGLTQSERYVVIAPTAIACLASVLFPLCLGRQSYFMVSHFFCGGFLSIAAFIVWLVDLIITMHSENSWAVNGFGEIKIANLYYFSWASIITAGLQMMSFVNPLLGSKEKDSMTLVWVAEVKVCFVIFGAAGHIWYTIRDSCFIGFDATSNASTSTSLTSSAEAFCARTVLAMIVAMVGMAFGAFMVLMRLLFSASHISSSLMARVEAVVSVFLVLLFGVTAAFITGIGGPGQSVGDLYYSTWLAFWVSIGTFCSWYYNYEDNRDISESGEGVAQNSKPENFVLL